MVKSVTLSDEQFEKSLWIIKETSTPTSSKKEKQPEMNIDLATQPLQFDPYNPKTEKFNCYLLRLNNDFDMKKLTGNEAETKKAETQILINSIGAK